MVHEFEIITDKTANFKAFINVLKYRAPHIHMDIEIGIVLFGELTVVLETSEYTLSTGDIMCVNPCQMHEFKSENEASVLLIQVNPSYFNNFFPAIHSIEFTELCTYKQENNPLYIAVRDHMIEFADIFMEKNDLYQLRCSGLLNLMFSDLLLLIPHRVSSAGGRLLTRHKADRIRKIADYIEDHYFDKIKLADLASLLDVTETHMSHFFTDNFHMTFQEYLMNLRCEKARSLLLATDLSLLDISVSCGFSDPKYLNKGFIRQYGCSPSEYRVKFGEAKLSRQQTSMLTTQQILSDNTSLVLLRKYSESALKNCKYSV